jgi:hypothetical protein
VRYGEDCSLERTCVLITRFPLLVDAKFVRSKHGSGLIVEKFRNEKVGGFHLIHTEMK